MITVDGQNTVFSQNPSDLFVKPRDVEPVDGLARGHEVNRAVAEWKVVGALNPGT